MKKYVAEVRVTDAGKSDVNWSATLDGKFVTQGEAYGLEDAFEKAGLALSDYVYELERE